MEIQNFKTVIRHENISMDQPNQASVVSLGILQKKLKKRKIFGTFEFLFYNFQNNVDHSGPLSFPSSFSRLSSFPKSSSLQSSFDPSANSEVTFSHSPEPAHAALQPLQDMEEDFSRDKQAASFTTFSPCLLQTQLAKL